MGRINCAKLWRRILSTKTENSNLREAEKFMQMNKRNKVLFISLTASILLVCGINGVMVQTGQQRQTFSPMTVSRTADSQACNKIPEYRIKLQGPYGGFASNQIIVGLIFHKE